MLQGFVVVIIVSLGSLLAQSSPPVPTSNPAAHTAPAATPHGQEPQRATPAIGVPAATPPTETQGEAAPAERARGRRGRQGQGQAQGQAAGPFPANVPGANQAARGGDAAAGDEEAPKSPVVPRRGLPVDDLLVQTHCARCHARDAQGLMTRISYLRKSPEGWSESLKRMIRLHGLQIAPAEAKEIVRYLANNQGLTRLEAERSLYESERRVHWSEENQDKDFRSACAGCHTLGRVLSQARDSEEWQLLRATHVAMFPLARGQMGGGPPDEERSRMSGDGGSASTGAAGGTGGQRPSTRTGQGGANGGGANGGGGASGGGRSGGGSDLGDRVLNQLAEKQALFTPEWDAWTNNRREVPLAGTWTVTGHETGRGDLIGTAVMTRVEADEYEVTWQLSFRNGDRVVRTGRGLLYGGYSWRGRTTDPGKDGKTWREVLLLDDRWETLRGRFFTGDYDELGVDVQLVRQRGIASVLAVESPWITVPAQGHILTVFGEAFPANVSAQDFHLGKDITVTACEFVSATQVKLTLDVAPAADSVVHQVAYGSEKGQVQVQLYDAVDYVRIRPLQGLSRIGGSNFPKQLERFEAVAVQRGKDGKPYTEDDVDLWMVPAKWRLVEAAVRDDDDDLSYVGTIDPDSGMFSPAVDGPNAQRKWSANNTGEVYVECTTDLHVPERKEPPKVEPPVDKPADKPAGEVAPQQANSATAPTPRLEPEPATPPPVTPVTPVTPPVTPVTPPVISAPPISAEPEAPQPTAGQPKLVARSFRARSNLIITVPQYVRWARLEWEDR